MGAQVIAQLCWFYSLEEMEVDHIPLPWLSYICTSHAGWISWFPSDTAEEMWWETLYCCQSHVRQQHWSLHWKLSKLWVDKICILHNLRIAHKSVIPVSIKLYFIVAASESGTQIKTKSQQAPRFHLIAQEQNNKPQVIDLELGQSVIGGEKSGTQWSFQPNRTIFSQFAVKTCLCNICHPYISI